MLELLWLLVAAVLIMGLAYLSTRMLGGGMSRHISGAGHNKMLRVVEQLYLGRDRQIVLVQVGERYFLLGNTAEKISTLAELSPEEIAAWREKEMGEQETPPSFRQALKEVWKQRRR